MFTSSLRKPRSIIVATVGGLLLGLLPAAPGVAAEDREAATPAAAAAAPDCAELQRQLPAMRAAGRTGTAMCTRALAAPTAAAPSAVPSCVPGGGWAFTRSVACFDDRYQLEFRTIPQGVLIGIIFVRVTAAAVVQARSPQWGQAVTVTGTSQSGAVQGTSIHVKPVCRVRCGQISPPIGTTYTRPFGAGVTLRENAVFETPYVGAEQVWYSAAAWEIHFSNPNTTPPESNTLTFVAPAHRCDDRLGAPTPYGCVYDPVIPEYNPDPVANPLYAKHIRFAIAYGVTSVLTRHRDAARSEANGAKACPGRLPRPQNPTHQCDEYPFRSTMEGAVAQTFGTTFRKIDLNGPGTNELICKINDPAIPLRNTYMPGGYSVCMIPETQNRDGGQELAKFYIDYRVIPDDKFTVRVL